MICGVCGGTDFLTTVESGVWGPNPRVTRCQGCGTIDSVEQKPLDLSDSLWEAGAQPEPDGARKMGPDIDGMAEQVAEELSELCLEHASQVLLTASILIHRQAEESRRVASMSHAARQHEINHHRARTLQVLDSLESKPSLTGLVRDFKQLAAGLDALTERIEELENDGGEG